jgi:hypothetical protein
MGLRIIAPRELVRQAIALSFHVAVVNSSLTVKRVLNKCYALRPALPYAIGGFGTTEGLVSIEAIFPY